MAIKAHRFLYATDLSKYSNYGIHYAVKLATTHAAKLLICSYDPCAQRGIEPPPFIMAKTE
jgi:hypothetical protein